MSIQDGRTNPKWLGLLRSLIEELYDASVQGDGVASNVNVVCTGLYTILMSAPLHGGLNAASGLFELANATIPITEGTVKGQATKH
jgi:hypothetical protein